MSYTFIRWLRAGMSASLEGQPQPTSTAERAKLNVGVDVSGTGLQSSVGTTKLEVLGPGDVTGIDPRQVVRMYPVPGTLDFEPSYRAHVEFDRPDLPWLLTPFGPDASQQLRPWICLVVLEKGEGVELIPGTPPTLKVSGTAVSALPTLGDLPQWAHVQITGDTTRAAEAITADEPERIVSRLICPSKLSAGKSYLACVVPRFKRGALAGLGRDVPATAGLDAWTNQGTNQDTLVELPVYHQWEFSTGGEGDFSSLVQRLESRSQLPGVGTRELDITDPGFGLQERANTVTVELGGALRVDEPADPPIDSDFASELEPIANEADAVGPPIYGRWHAAAEKVTDPGAGPAGWLDGLNLDPRYRAAAGLGTLVVQERQEDLMAAIWQQLAEILRANQLLRQAQLAVAASERIVARHLAPLSHLELLSVAGPTLPRIRVAPGKTARRAIAESCMPWLAFSGAFRKIVRAHGPIERRIARSTRDGVPDRPPPPAIDIPSMLDSLANGWLVAPPAELPDGAVALPADALPTRSRYLPGPRDGRILRGPRDGRLRERDADIDRAPLGELGPLFNSLASRVQTRACTPLDAASLAATVRTQLDPDLAVAARARAQIDVPNSSRVLLTRRLDPIMAAPEIPTPMIGPLQELGNEWLLPGIDEIPPNSLAIVEPDSAFIEAYMVGLNHEMGRELLWRGFPTDQRGTVFSRFWDRRGSVSTRATPVPDRDIPEIHQWDTKDALGEHLNNGSLDLVVLLVRGDLLQRYPRATIYLQRARWDRDQGIVLFEDGLALRSPVPLAKDSDWDDNTRFPVFSGRVGADITFLGFGVSKLEVRGIDRADAKSNAKDSEAGWYVVFQEQPTEPRFGDDTAATQDSDTLASQLLRKPFRLFVHAGDLVPE
jgi:hypothetical protein